MKVMKAIDWEGINMQLYDKIFRVANENMISNGQTFSFGQVAFKSIIGKNPEIIEISEFETIPEEECLASVYLRCLNRLPDAEIEKHYKDLLEMVNGDKKYANYLIFKTITKSVEFKNLNKQIRGLAVLKKEIRRKKDTYRIRIYVQQIKAESRLIIHDYIFEPIWKQLPNRFKNVIRVICGREKNNDNMY